MSKSLQLINNLKQKKQIEYHQKIRDERDVHLQSTLDLLDTYAEIAHLSMFIYEQLPASLLSKFLKHQEKNNTLSNLFEKILPMIGGIKVSVEPMLPFIKPTLDLLKQINKNLNKLSVKDQNKLKKMMEKFFLNYTDVSVEQLSMDFMNTQWLKGSLAGLELYLFLSKKIGLTLVDFIPFVDAFKTMMNIMAHEETTSDDESTAEEEVVFSTSELYEEQGIINDQGECVKAFVLMDGGEHMSECSTLSKTYSPLLTLGLFQRAQKDDPNMSSSMECTFSR